MKIKKCYSIEFVGLVFGANLFEASFSKVSFIILPLFDHGDIFGYIK